MCTKVMITIRIPVPGRGGRLAGRALRERGHGFGAGRMRTRDRVTAASECGGRVAGGGMAWLKAWQLRPELDFHCSDRAHPSELGYYLNACVIFAAFSDKSPLGLDPYSLNKSDAEFLQKIAWEQYQDDRRKEKK